MKKEIERVKGLLSQTSPLSQDYGMLLSHIERITWLCDRYEPEVKKPIESPGIQDPDLKNVKEPFPTAEPIPEPVGEPERPAVVDDVPLVEEKEEKLTKEKVRAMLKEAAESGVLVQDIMLKFIPQGKKATFSSIKASDYPALVKELEDAK